MKKSSLFLIGILFLSVFTITDISVFGINDQNIETNFNDIEIIDKSHLQTVSTDHNVLLFEKVTIVTNNESNDDIVSQQQIQSTKNIKLTEKLSILENDKLDNLINYVKHNSEKIAILERVNPNRIRDNTKLDLDEIASPITPKQIVDNYNINNLISKQSLNLDIAKYSIPTFSIFDFVQNNNVLSNNYDILVASTQNIVSIVDENNKYFLVLLVPLSGYILLRTESRKINFINTRLASSSLLTIILISSAVLTPFSIGSSYWGIAYAAEFSFSGLIEDANNNLESNPIIPESINATSTESINATSTESINATSTESINATSTESINATSTESINATSTESINATSTESINATSTESINATSTESINATSTESINATSTESINATSTESINATSTESINATSTESINATSTDISSSTVITSDTLLDLNFDTENTNQTNSTILQLDGNNDFIAIQNNSTDVLSTFTISGWIKPDYSNGSNEFTIISKENSFILSMNNNLEPEHTAKFSIFDGIKWTYVESTNTIQEQWTHISATFDGNYIKIYINGKLEAITELTDTITISVDGKIVETQVDTIYSDQDIVIGAYVSTNDGSPQLQNKFSGEIDDISLHNSIFDEQKLNQIYQEQFDYYSSLDIELSLEEIMQQIIQENALATNSTLIPTNSTVTQLDLIHETIEIGKPVMWTQTVELSNQTDGITIEIPEDAEIIQVTTMDQQTQEILYNAEDKSKTIPDNIQSEPLEMEFKGIMDNADIKENQISNLRIENSTDPEQYNTLIAFLDKIPEQIQQDKPTKLLVVNDTADQIEIKFETPAPYVIEEEHSTNSLYNKTVTVAHDSTLHYTNVASYSAIPEDLVSQGIVFDLFWNINGTKVNVTSDPNFAVKFVDTDGNGIINQMQWIVPQMSEQDFEIVANIVIVNVQSYPVVGDTWEVRFTTNGTADLIITAIDETTFGESLPDDLKLLSIKCGENIIQHQWVNGSIVIQNYTCSETGYETSQVLTPGKHHLEFRFGNSISYANNNAFFVDEFSINLPLGVDTYNDNFLSASVNDSIVNVTSSGTINWNQTSSGTGNGAFDGPTGIAVNSTGYIYIADTGNDRIQILTPAGVYSNQFGTLGSGDNQFTTPIGIAIDSSDNIYVADTGNDRITKHNKDGSFIEAYGTGFGSGDTQFSGPTGIAVNSTGYIYIADTGNDRVKILTPAGVYSNQFGTLGSGDNQFTTPIGIAIDSSDNIYVADTGNDRITKHNKDGSFIESFGTSGTGPTNFDGPTGISVFSSSDNIYAADTGNDKIKKYDTGIRSKSESLPLSDTLTKSISKSLAESLSLSDNTVGIISGKSVSLTESLPFTASATTSAVTSVSLTESLPFTASATTSAVTSVSLTESLPFTDTLTKSTSKSLAESLSLTASATTSAVTSVSLTESLPFTDTLTKSTSKSLAESLSLSDTVNTTNLKSVSLTESLPFTDTLTKSTSKSLAESLSLTASATTSAVTSVSLTESLPFTDTLTKSTSKSLAESLSLSDTVNTTNLKSVSLTESLPFTDTLTKSTSKSLAESLSLTASATTSAVTSVSLTESLPFTDTLTKSTSKSLAESLSLSDTVNTTNLKSVSLTESLPFTDTLTKSTSKSLAESLSLTASATTSAVTSVSLTESLPFTDTLTKSTSKSLAESLSLSDTVNTTNLKSVSLTESLPFTDTLTKSTSKSLAESLSLTASATTSAVTSVSLTESLPFTDTLTKSTSKSLAESLSLSDNTVSIISAKSVSLTESLPLSDTLTKSTSKSLTESLPLSDTLTKSTSKSLAESLSLSDTVNTTNLKSVSLTESLPFTDTLTKSTSKSLAESLSLTASATTSAVTSVSLTESLPFTDTLTKSTSKSLAESLSLSDTVNTTNLKSVSLTESLPFTDTLTKSTSKSLAESLSLTASATTSAVTSVSLTESLPFTDTLTKSTSKSLAESLSLSDNTVSIISAKSVSLTESLPLSDTLTKSTSKSLAESLPLSDTLTKSTSKSLAESLSLSDTVNTTNLKSVSLTESLPFTDTLTKSTSKSLAESLLLTASATTSAVTSVSLTESLPLSDTLTKSTSKSLAESLSLSDTVNTTNLKSVSLTESLPFTDTLTKSTSKSLAESLSLTASATTSAVTSVSLTESLPLSATANTSASKSVSLTESLPFTDTVNTTKSKLISLTESLPFTATATTNAALTRSLAESLPFTAVANFTGSRSVLLTESLSLTDLLNKNTIHMQTDLLSLMDNLAISVIPGNTTSPVKLYPGSTTTEITLAQNNTSVILTSSSIIQTITIPDSVTTQLVINYTSSLSSNSSGTFVPITNGFDVIFNTTNTNSVNTSLNVTIANSTTLTGPTGWNGILDLPTTTSVTIPQTTTNGVTTTYSEVAAFELGLNGSTIQLSNPVRIKFTGSGVGNPAAFFVGTNAVTTIISTECTSDSASGMPSGADECYFDNGDDLIIWTDHFTKFGTSQRSTSSTGGSTGSSSGSAGTSGSAGKTGVGPAGTTRGFGGILGTLLTINEITYDRCEENMATILVSSDADKAPSVIVHTARSGSVSAKLANIQPYEQSNKITKLDKYLYEIPITSDETFLMVVVTEEKGVSKNTVQSAIHLTSCEGATVISKVPEEKYEEIALSAPKIFDVKFQIENNTQHSSETESEFSYVDNQDLSVSAIVDAQSPLQRSELRVITMGQSQEYIAIKMDVESLPISNSTYVISAKIPSSLMQEPAISYWIHIIDENQNEAESKQYNIGVKPISVGDVTFEMDIASVKESGSLVRPQLFVDNKDLPSYGIVSLIVNGETISKKSQLFATGETIVNLEWKSPSVDEHTIYSVMTSVDLYDKSISTQSAKLHIYPKTITMLASEIKSLEQITTDDTVLADPALIYASNSVDQNLGFHVIAPNGQCIIGVSEECAIHGSTANQRGGLTSIEYEDQIIRVRYSGPDSSLERFSITSIDPLVDNWIVSLETSDGIIPQAQAMKDLSIKVKYRIHSEIITIYSE